MNSRLLPVSGVAATGTNYQDWVRTEVECVGCTRVILEVIDPTSGVPEDPAMLLNSWGQLKTLYR
jgi:hypothetical protein